MKTWILHMGTALGVGLFAALLLGGCSSAYYASSRYASDDLYVLHDRTQIARKQQAEAEARKAAAEARQAEWEAKLAEARAAAAEDGYYEYNANPFESVLADDYESAYARRLRGFESPSYNMPSSYINARYSGAFDYVSAYDPAFYNVIVMGDEVWVEPKYITAMFGTWGRPVVYLDPWYYGWAAPSFSFSVGSWGWGFGWNSWYSPWYSAWYNPWWGPWYSAWYDPWWGPGWGWRPWWGPGWHGHPHWGWGPGWGPSWGGGGGHYNPNRPNIVHRPSRPYRSQTFGGGSTNINRSTGGNRSWRSGVYQGGGSSSSRGTVSRGNDRTGTVDWIRGNSSNSDRTGTRRAPSSSSFDNSSRGGSFGGGSFGGSTGGGFSGGARSGGSTGSSSRGR